VINRIFTDTIDRKFVGEEITISGWVDTVRDHGGVIFIDLRNMTGKLQCVFDVAGKDEEFKKLSESIRPEWVVEVKGVIRERPPESVNPKIPTGEVELLVGEFKILNRAKNLPFYPDDSVSEELRLKYRFLDLRSQKMRRNLLAVSRIMKITRDYFDELGFVEVPTPMLTKSTPEGARDYIVPARLKPGCFFALPQSPQLFKQILMASGIEKYYQIVRCFRDEDTRGDRQPEFNQIDLEMAFAEKEDVMDVVWGLVEKVFNEFAVKFERPAILDFEDAIKMYGTDKPDLRIKISPLKDISEIFKNTGFEIFKKQIAQGNPVVCFFSNKNFSRSELDELVKVAKEEGLSGLLWIKKEGDSLKSPATKFLKQEEIKALSKIYEAEGTIFVVAGKSAFFEAGLVREKISQMHGLKEEGFYPLWIVNAPLFELDKDGKITSVHHPFTAPVGDIFKQDPLTLKSLAYDLVINGVEIGGGSIRIHSSDIQKKVFEILGMDEKQYSEKFSFLLRALESGCPPHGGFAFGLERFVAILFNLPSIREVIAFPKTQNVQCLLTDAPSPVSEKQLKELSIKVDI